MIDTEQKTDSEQKETISGQDVLAPFEGEKGRIELFPVKQSGLRLAGGVLLIIAVVTLLVVAGWFVVTLKAPAESGAMLDNSLKLYDGIVGKILYPLLTLLIGYVFGRGGRGSEG